GVAGSELAQLEGVHAALAANIALCLLPNDRGELFGDSRFLDKGVADVDEELEGYGELVVHDARGNKDTLRAADVGIAVADRAIAEFAVIVLGNAGIVPFAHR